MEKEKRGKRSQWHARRLRRAALLNESGDVLRCEHGGDECEREAVKPGGEPEQRSAAALEAGLHSLGRTG